VSTGVFADTRGAWQRLVVKACAVSTYAVELSALSDDELPGLVDYLAAKPRLPFRYISVHAPVKNRVVDDAFRAEMLNRLPLGVRSIVAHPDAMDDPGVFRQLGSRLLLENMTTVRAVGAPHRSLASSSSSCLTLASVSTSRTRGRSIRVWL
jgi:hypothetical protein